MKRTFSTIAAVAMILGTGAGSAQAQGLFNKIKNKVKEKVEQKIDNAIDKAVNGAVDGATNAAKGAVNGSSEDYDPVANPAGAPSTQSQAPATADVSNVKSDFVPGSIVVFEDKVSGEQVGEFPSKWDLERGNAEIATVNGEQVIEFAKEDSWIKPLISKNPKNYFGDEFTVEFDLMYTEGGFEIDFMHPDEARDHEIFTLTWGYNYALRLDYVRASSESNTDKEGDSSQDQKTQLNDKRWHHYAISFNKRVIKVYVDGIRYMNVPAAKAGAGWMTFFYRGDQPAYMKNVRIARGGGELYGRNATDASEGAIAKAIAETGKFVTNNILFETGKADLKPESMDEIQKVADYMKKNATARFLVVGHTDNVGSATSNQTLSEKRAKSVVAALAKLGVDDFNLKAEGRGASEPVADNKTAEGKAKNRRVEFIKK
ncbi:OmpA family protein [Sodaliphilus sp.]|uniref:OmpA family protein n=1 Tax=Sodaliphilus sp. TaxID=2815818 RepID=UPI00388EDDD7